MSLVITRILSFLTIVTIGDSFTDSEDIWPSGLYSLPKPISGCPETTLWSDGWIKQDLEDTNHGSSFSLSFHMNATLTIEYINRTFCVKNIGYGTYQKSWPTGSYCIYQGTCSSGMVSGWIHWDDEDSNNANERGGTLPAGVFGRDTKLYYCCQNQGQWFNPINLPTDKPFYLLPHGSRNCQRVKWALSSLEFIIYDTENGNNGDVFNGNHVFTNQIRSFPKIFYCYYVGCRYKLENYYGFFSSFSKHSPDYSYPNYQYCSWLITVNKTHVVSLSFLNISVPNCQENFIEIFDGVSSNETQLLARLCGQNATSERTIKSTGNNLYVVFKSGNNSKRPTLKLGFYAKYEAHHMQPDIWPSGLYSLPKPISGCPETTLWSEGWITQDLEDTNHMSSFSSSFHMNATLTTEYINRTFCVQNIDYGTYQKSWPTGSYCIYQKYCSSGMASGSIYWDDENSNNGNERGGTLPAGEFNDDTLLYYCCQNQGQWFNPIDLPTDKPFYLLPHGSTNCQRVKWALSSLEFIIYDTEDDDYSQSDRFIGDHVFTDKFKGFPKIFYCYYVGCRYKLENYYGFFSASSKHSPDYSYPDYQYCSWLITVNKTHVVSLSFLNISVPDCQENFIDIFDGASSNETQLLARLCGQNATSGRTIKSTGNNLYVVFKSGDNSKYPTSKLGFYAKYEAHHVQPETPTTTTSTLTTTLQSGTSSETETEATATTNTETKVETETSTKIGGEISSTKQAFGGNTNFQNNGENKSTTVLPIVLPILAVLLISLAIIFFWRRHKQKNNGGSTEVETRQNVFYDARINTVDTTMQAVSSRYEMPPWVSRPQESQTQDVAVVGRDSMNLIYESAGIVNNTNTDQVYCSADNVVYEAGHDIAENDDPSSSIYNHPDEITTDSTYSTPTISSPSEVHKIPGLSTSQSEPEQDGIYDNVE